MNLLACIGLVLTMDQGRIFNLEEGQFVMGTQPGVEASCGPVTVSFLATYGDRAGFLSRDMRVDFDRERGCWTFGAYAARYDYRAFDRDIVFGARLRFRVR